MAVVRVDSRAEVRALGKGSMGPTVLAWGAFEGR